MDDSGALARDHGFDIPDLPRVLAGQALRAVAQPVQAQGRPAVRGKFLFVGEEKFWVRGVTYGTFRPDEAGLPFPARTQVAEDFAAMARAGLNAVRVYVPPPGWLLDEALSHGLRVLVGLPWEQHVAFLDSPGAAASILQRTAAAVAACAGHPAVLAFAVGNEIPAPVVRWYGRRRVQSFLGEMAEVVRAHDPGALVTYVNFPTTEYLDTPFVDFVSFNVYLESRETLLKYLARLQNIAGEKPLLMAEIGLDSRSNNEAVQAATLEWQVRAAFEAGCAGSFVFAWTDEWHRGGFDIEDWDFGLTTRDRRPKPALATVAEAFSELPFPGDRSWPRISVVVCSFNGARTIEETLAALQRLNYPDYEVIVVDDGSTDATGDIAKRFPVRLIQTDNRGLSSARNTGARAASGEIVAYTDDDAYPDPDWLLFLANAFQRTEHVGMGGPNIAPPGDGPIAGCVANAPGGPVHVLISDEVAEHIPGCNMAFRRDRLLDIGGFDAQFRVAGDDVDVCWRLQARGWTLGFSPAAMVWHHRRNSISRFLKQQRGYAKAEALLARKWPEKYNSAGHMLWHGRLYGRGVMESVFQQSRIYHGSWGVALFQSVYQPSAGLFSSLPLMPEWYFLVAALGVVGALGVVWPPLYAVLALFVLAFACTLLQAIRGGMRADIQPRPAGVSERWRMKAIVAYLHLMQPGARLLGRIEHGLGPWAPRWKALGRAVPRPTSVALWSERWEALESRLAALERVLHDEGVAALRGGDFSRWDLDVRGGALGSVRSLAMVEEHGAGRQMIRLRAWPRIPGVTVGAAGLLTALAVAAGLNGSPVAAAGLGAGALVLAVAAYADAAAAMAAWRSAVRRLAKDAALMPR